MENHVPAPGAYRRYALPDPGAYRRYVLPALRRGPAMTADDVLAFREIAVAAAMVVSMGLGYLAGYLP